MNPEEITKVAEKMYVENCADKTAFSLFMNGFQCGAQWRLEFDNTQKKNKEALPYTSTNKTHDAISAIKGALRIVNLWLPKTASVEHAEEARALHKMHSAFLSVVQKQHH